MNFANPLALLLLLALPLGWLIAWPRRSPTRPVRETAGLIARGLIILLIVLALARTQQVQTTDDLVTVFLLDASDSVDPAGRQAGLDYIRRALAAMGPGDRWGLVLFGSEALVDRPVSSSPTLGEPASVPRSGYTDVAGAIQLGLTLFPDDAARRLVILSDGGANLGDAREAAQLAAASGVQVSVLPLPARTGVEARLDELRVPSLLHQGEQFDLIVEVHSTAAMTAPLQIFSEGRLIAQQVLTLRPGDNAFSLRAPLAAGEPGFTTFQARLVPPLDTFAQNNVLDAFSEVRGPLSVLLVTEDADEARPLAAALRGAGLAVTEIGPAALPSDLGQLGQAAAVVLVNVSAANLAPRQLELLQSYVRDLGGGLIVIGGDRSYAPGGYFQTPLEETLPVEMTIRDQQRLPGMTMMMVIDKSGSMASGGAPDGGGPRKVELAKEAIYRSVDLLVPWDRVGVIAFDNAARWVLEPTPAVNVQGIKNAVGTIRAGGGTDILAGLQLAAEAILREETRLRHIILLTDGGASPEGIPELAESLAAQEVTVSVVAIGQGYAPFLEEVARLGGGRFHFADDATVIPQIFAQETSLASRSYIVEETFSPEVVSPSPILQGLAELPPLRGYVATSPKMTAQLVLRGGSEGDPLLAQWQYGLGRSVAWTSDAKGQWALDWVRWPDFARFWSQAVRWTLVEGAGGGLESQVRLEGDRATIAVEALDAEGRFLNNLDLSLNLVGPDLAPQALSLRQTAPGLYEGDFRPEQTGTYLLRLSAQAGQEVVAAQTTGFVLTYSPEYRTTGVDAALLPDLAEIGGGQVLSLAEPGAAFAHSLPPARGQSDLWPGLLALAVLLLPLDVGLRRVVFGREEAREAWAKIRARLPQRRAVQPEPSSAGRLLKVKERRPGPEPPPPPDPRPVSTGPAGVTPRPPPPPGVPAAPADEAGSTVRRLVRAKQRRRG
ncbi:MAG: VWA domain-containing protein, partial [Anaerolineae bacterium]